MAKKPSALAGIFDDEPEAVSVPEEVAPVPEPETQIKRSPASRSRRSVEAAAPTRRSSHPGKKPVLIHIPEDMHRTLRQLRPNDCREPFWLRSALLAWGSEQRR
jgi:hypothetical protein